MARFTRQARRNENKIAGMYDLEERLGAGHFAEVKLARHVFTGERVAVKVIDKMKLDDTAKHHLFQEVRCMKLVQHPNIVRLYEVIDTNTKLYLVQELGDGGDMYDYIMKHEKGLDEDIARRYFRQILQAIHYCHKLYVVHRDLKPENVIFFKKFDVAKLTDFGFSNKFMPGKKLETACGSLAYSAPEILLGDSYDAPAVDVWSLGVILYMMVVGKAPFYEANESETLTMILDCKFHIPDYVSPACKKLISKMIVRDVTKRALLEDIMGDPWIVEDHGPMLVTTVPLANQVRLGEDQHNEIVQKMLIGDIADKETIKKCLEAGSYNHISATYYLLAEQVLRRLRWHTGNTTPQPKANNEKSSSTPPNKSNGVSTVAQQQPLPQLSEEDKMDDTEPDVSTSPTKEFPYKEPGIEEEQSCLDTNLVTTRLRYHSTDSVYEPPVKNGNDNDEPVLASVSVNVTKKQMRTFQKQRVFGVKSTPAFLNQISEERESDLDDSPRASPRVRRLSRRTLGVVQAQSSCRLSWSSGGRSSSVSSSSEEDVDLDRKMRRLSTERCRRSPKRRSDDEGDGDDGEDGTKSSRGVAKKKRMRGRSQASFDETNTVESEDSVDNKGQSGDNKEEIGDNKGGHVDTLGAVLKDRLIEVHLKLNEFKKCEVDSDQRDSRKMDIAEDSNGNLARKRSLVKPLERRESWEGNLHGRESLTWTVRGEGGKEVRTTEVAEGIEEEGIVVNTEEDRDEGLIRIGIVENGILKYGVSADVVPEEEDDSMEEVVESEVGLGVNTKCDNTEELISKDGITNVDIMNFEDSPQESPRGGPQHGPQGPETGPQGPNVGPQGPNVGTHITPQGSHIGPEVGSQSPQDCPRNGPDGPQNDPQSPHDRLNDCRQGPQDGPEEIECTTDSVSQDGNNTDVLESQIMTVFQESTCTTRDTRGHDGTLMNFSDLETCSNGSIPRVLFRGSDIDEIEMYMKAKETGLELESVGVRTIYHNRKVSQVTSNCCHII